MERKEELNNYSQFQKTKNSSWFLMSGGGSETTLKKRECVQLHLICMQVNSKYKASLIVMQSQSNYNYKSILVYQDHVTNLYCCGLWELKLQRKWMFLLFWILPAVQNDIGHDLCNYIIQEVLKIWSKLKIVHWKVRQGSVERAYKSGYWRHANTWTETNHITHWLEAIALISSW